MSAEQVEDTELTVSSSDGCEELEVKILVVPHPGQDIRAVGCDIPQGQLVLTQGTYLAAAEIGLAASVGARSLKVYPKPLVGLLSTGASINYIAEKSFEIFLYS